MGCGASAAEAKYAEAKKSEDKHSNEKDKKKKKDHPHTHETNKPHTNKLHADPEDAQILHHRSRKRSISTVLRPNQRLIDYYVVENRGLAFASTQTASREPRSDTRITLKATGEIRTCRTIRKRRVDSYNANWEVEAMLRLDHPNIVKLFEVFEDEVNIYVILQFCEGGKVLSRIQREHDLSESAVAHITQQLLAAVNHLHAAWVCHRNLTLEHVYFYEKGAPLEKTMIKLCDFELAIINTKENASMNEVITQYGNVAYMAPELLKQSPRYFPNVDIWAVGVCTFVLLCGQYPFSGSTVEEVGQQITNWNPLATVAPDSSTMICKSITSTHSTEFHVDWGDAPEAARAFVISLLEKDHEKRCEAVDALHMPWLTTAHKAPRKLMTPAAVQGILSFGTKSIIQKKCMQVIAAHLPEEEIKDLAKTFQTLDSNGDGEVSLNELKHAVALASRHKGAKGKRKNSVAGTSDAELMRLVEAMDSNGDKRISYTEFLAACLEEKHYTQEAACWHAFRYFDRDTDGRVTRQELFEALKDEEFNDMLPQKVIADLIKSADTNGNQTLDFYEFMALVQPDREWVAPQPQAAVRASSKGPASEGQGSETPSAPLAPLPPSPLKSAGKNRKNSKVDIGLCPGCGATRQLKERDKRGMMCAACWMDGK